MSHVQSLPKVSASLTSDTLMLPGVGAGHSLLVALRLSGNADYLTSFADSIDGLIPRAANQVSAANAIRTYLYKKEACSAGDHAFTAVWSQAVSWRWIAAEYSESAIDVMDVEPFASDTGIVGPSVAPTVAGGTLVGIISLDSSASIAPNNSETERQEVNTALQLEDLALAGLGPYAPQWLLGAARPGVAISVVMKGTASTQLDDHTSFRGLARGMFRGF